jgi:hypothetical protein
MRVDQPWLGPLRCTDATAADAVVSAYLHACDCAGDAPSQRQLAAQFGVSRARVAALVSPLNGTPDLASSQPAQCRQEVWTGARRR